MISQLLGGKLYLYGFISSIIIWTCRQATNTGGASFYFLTRAAWVSCLTIIRVLRPKTGLSGRQWFALLHQTYWKLCRMNKINAFEITHAFIWKFYIFWRSQHKSFNWSHITAQGSVKKYYLQCDSWYFYYIVVTTGEYFSLTLYHVWPEESALVPY